MQNNKIKLDCRKTNEKPNLTIISREGIMKQKVYLLLVVFIAVLSIEGSVIGQPLDCLFGSSSRWGSGWCDFEHPINLTEGTCLRLSIGGTANKILVRILRAGEDPNEPIGLLGNPITVPNNRKIIIRLERTYSNVVQISVHGGPQAWHFNLGSNNGPATLLMVEQVECPTTN